MDVRKPAVIEGAGAVTQAQLERINRLARSPLRAEQVYVFAVRLCDDQPDRDGERFDTAALPRLAELFVGKTGIADHEWSAEKQISRIFDTELVQEGAVRYIKAWAYMLRGEKADPVIAEIDGGIKKEVSVGCSMGGRVCSVCGQEYGKCPHRKGRRYDGRVCTAVLTDPLDAYEFSFVAVPAQPLAGVVKGLGGGRLTLEQFVGKYADFGQLDEFQTLCRQAADGRGYRGGLCEQIVRLGLAVDAGLDEPTLRTVAGRMDTSELERMKRGLERRAAALFPPDAQLPSAGKRAQKCGEEFLI